MRALFVGMGSVGQRHLKNLKNLIGPAAELFALRSTNHNLIIENGIAHQCDSLADYWGYEQVATLEKGLALKPDIVFVTNPSSMHIDVALAAAKAGCNLFIEKPLSHNFDGVDELKSILESNDLSAVVGYQTRFHPCFTFVKSILAEASFGSLISAGFEWGTFLPDHHPYEDYRLGYAANNDLGGGVTLGLIHEIDLIYSFLGIPKSVAAIGGSLSSLDMSAEDTVSVLMGFEQNHKLVPVSLHLSYAQVHEVRGFRMQFNEALLVCNLMSNTVLIYGKNGKILDERRWGEVDQNELFKSQMFEFISLAMSKEGSSVSLQNGIDTLAIALRIKESFNGFNG
ncbi:Gfo/Idh/MocA family oxidoreductase [Candidatus Njordibacter sp. Uisw_039]|uniref:Gfo/Idh/MocA family protein n=1 Tax=Candidatus Njordibacter sp. Uisw_039 TaxID=3230972 RepID=UPI003D4092FA